MLRVASRRVLAQASTSASVLVAARSVPRSAVVNSPSRFASSWLSSWRCCSSSAAVVLPTPWPLASTTPGVVRSSRLIAPSTHRALSTTSASSSSSKPTAPHHAETQQPQQQQEGEEADSPPPKAGFRERLKFLTRRYGWWALGVYLAASSVDFSLTFLAIHLLGAEHIKSLEASLRKSIGLEARPESTEAEQAANHASSTIWTEAVLAYTIHKTLLLPFRVMVTAAVTPSFVKWLVRMGWAKANHQVKAQVGRNAADKAINDVVNRHKAAQKQATQRVTKQS